MKHPEDKRTLNLVGVTSAGRPARFGKPMTMAERQARVRAEREIRRAAAKDNLRTIVYEVDRLRHAIAAGAAIEDLQETCKGIEEAALGTLAVLRLE